MKKFSTSISGYNNAEVNHFVSEVASEYESMLNNLKRRDEEIKALREKLTQYTTMENTLNKALVLAEDTGTQIKKIARDESKAIIDEAKRNASRIVNEALKRAEKLEADGENLRRRIGVFKRKFRSIIESELENIDEIPDDY